jgi:hypothetical protein
MDMLLWFSGNPILIMCGLLPHMIFYCMLFRRFRLENTPGRIMRAPCVAIHKCSERSPGNNLVVFSFVSCLTEAAVRVYGFCVSACFILIFYQEIE